MKIDAHLHSINSDGTQSVEEIVKEAKSKNLDLIALTDHNTLSGNADLLIYSEKYNQKAIAGIEISTVHFGEDVHLLAYYPLNSNFFYPQYDSVNKINDKYKSSKIVQLEKIVNNLQKDFDVSMEEFMDFLGNEHETINRAVLATYLISKNIASSISEAFDTILSKNSKYYVEKEDTDTLDAIDAVLESGGFPVIAHIGQYKFGKDELKLKELFNDISKRTNEIGIELFHYDHDDEMINILRETSKEISKETGLNIIFSAGSDSHGKNKPNEIGIPWNEISDDNKKLYEKVSEDFIKFIEDKNILIENNIER